MPSLTDVAREAGVSLTTASMVLNKGKQHNRVSAACASRVQEAATRLGYVPNYHARSMKLGKAEVIAVAMDIGYEDDRPSGEIELDNPYFNHLLGGIEVRTRMLGYLMTVVGPDALARAPDRALMGVKQRRFDGIIVPAAVLRNDLTDFQQRPSDVPVVIVAPTTDTPHTSVVFDHLRGVDMAIEHLVELGHRRLLFVGEIAEDPHSHAREMRYVETTRRLGVTGGTCHVTRLEGRDVHHPDRQITQVAEDVGKFLASGWFESTAVVAYNDMTAIGVVEALLHAGYQVPKDVSVIGFDDTIARYCVPRLTTISHELSEMGRTATDLVMEMINEPGSADALRGTRTVISPRLVERSSTAPPKIGPATRVTR